MELYDRLTSLPWAKPPRTITPELEKRFRKMWFRPPKWMFWTAGPDAWDRMFQQAPIRFAWVVQANNQLYDPETAKYLPAVFMATEDERGADWRFVAEQGRALQAAVEAGAAPEVEEKLNAEMESMDFRVRPELTGGVPFRMWDRFIDPDKLPGGAIPDPKVLPVLLLDGKDFAFLPVAMYAEG